MGKSSGTVRLTIHTYLIPVEQKITLEAEVNQTWLELLGNQCDIHIDNPSAFFVETLNHGRTGKKGWRTKLTDQVKSFIDKYTLKKDRYSVRIGRLTSSSSRGVDTVKNKIKPQVQPNLVRIQAPSIKGSNLRVLTTVKRSQFTQPPVNSRYRLQYVHPKRPLDQGQVLPGASWKLKIKQRLAKFNNSVLLQITEEIRNLDSRGVWQRNVLHAPLCSTFLKDLLDI